MTSNTTVKIPPHTKTGVYEILRTSTVVRTVFRILSNTRSGVSNLYKTSKVVKTASYIFPDTQTGLHVLHGTFIVLSNSILTLKLPYSSFTRPPATVNTAFWSYLVLKLA